MLYNVWGSVLLFEAACGHSVVFGSGAPPSPRGAAPSCALLLHLTPLANGALSAEAEKMKVCLCE